MALDIACQRKVAITIDHTKVGSGGVSNFDVLLTRANLPDEMCSPTDSNAAQADGGDIRFSSDAFGVTQLACDIIAFEHDTTDGAGDAVVQIRVAVAALSDSADTTIYAWYSTSSTDSQPGVSDTYGRNATYDSSTVAYYAMHEDPSGSAPQMIDRTGNGNDGTSAGSMTDTDVVAGVVGNALELDGSDDSISIGDDPFDLTALTVEAWFKSSSGARQHIVTKGGGEVGGGYQWGMEISDHPSWAGKVMLAAYQFGGAGYISVGHGGSGTFNDGNFHHVVGLLSSTDATLYLDGSLYDTSSSTSGTWYSSGDSQTIIGRRDDGNGPFNGTIDEVRVSSVVRDLAYVVTRYANENSPSTFAAAGTPEVGRYPGIMRLPLHYRYNPSAPALAPHRVQQLAYSQNTTAHDVRGLLNTRSKQYEGLRYLFQPGWDGQTSVVREVLTKTDFSPAASNGTIVRHGEMVGMRANSDGHVYSSSITWTPSIANGFTLCCRVFLPTTATSANPFFFLASSLLRLRFEIGRSGGSNSVTAFVSDGTNTSSISWNDGGAYGAGVHHVAVVVIGSDTLLYFDGALVDSDTHSISSMPALDELRILEGDEYTLIEPRVYDRGLTQREILDQINPTTRWDLYQDPIRRSKSLAGVVVTEPAASLIGFVADDRGRHAVYRARTADERGHHGVLLALGADDRGRHGMLDAYTLADRSRHAVYNTRSAAERGRHAVLFAAAAQDQSLHRVANDADARYELYVGVDADPDLDGQPTETWTTLPHTTTYTLTPPGSGQRTYYLVTQRRNRYGVRSESREWTAVTIDAAGDLVATPPRGPATVAVTAQAGGTVRVLATYAPGDDPAPLAADTWLLYATSDGSAPLDATPTTSAMVNADGLAKLDVELGPFSNGTTVKVVVRTRRTGVGGADSTNTAVSTVTAATAGPSGHVSSGSTQRGIGTQL